MRYKHLSNMNKTNEQDLNNGYIQVEQIDYSSQEMSEVVLLRTRNNLAYNDVPYIPMLVENISTHCSFDDFEENRIKTIQTVGEIVPKSRKSAYLRSLTLDNESEFPIYFNNLSDDEIYIEDNHFYRPIWDKYIVFKVYGTLMLMGTKYGLETTHLVPVENFAGACHVLALLSMTACTEYRHYYRTRGQDRMLEAQWEQMEKEKKRLV